MAFSTSLESALSLFYVVSILGNNFYIHIVINIASLSSSDFASHTFLIPSSHHVEGLSMVLRLIHSDLYAPIFKPSLLIRSTCLNPFITFRFTLTLVYFLTRTLRLISSLHYQPILVTPYILRLHFIYKTFSLCPSNVLNTTHLY